MKFLDLLIRQSIGEDIQHVANIVSTIDAAAQSSDIATRSPELITSKIEQEHAALALTTENMVVGFGYISLYNDNVLSHSALVVHPEYRGRGIFRGLKKTLIDIGDKLFPGVDIISLTTSLKVKKVNESLGYKAVSLKELTQDKNFWSGCKGCKQYDEMQQMKFPESENSIGEYCCCSAMRCFR